ncbi:hypothetical protein VTI74DRAFT_4577 [Chaetomium olivicolor]
MTTAPEPVQSDQQDSHALDSDIEKILDEGRHLIEKGENSKALVVIMKAINMCPCNSATSSANRHGKDKSCNISQCTVAVQSKDSDALYQVASKPCTCGYAWPSCTRPLHAVALDALAVCLVKADQIVSAFSTALSIIRLDPASAVGYCRVAKILRHLLRHPKEPNSVTRRSAAVILRDANLGPVGLEFLLARFVKTGLHNTERYRRGFKDSYHIVLHQMGHSLKLKQARRDPVNKFPPEVLTMIFSLLDITSLAQCVRVSKQWNRVVLQDAMLWADLRLRRPQNPGRFFASFLQQRQCIKTFVLHDASLFKWTSNKLRNVVYGLPRLQQLCLDGGLPCTPNLADFCIEGKRGARLTRLSLISFDAGLVAKLVELNRETLEVLNLVDLQGELNCVFSSTLLPKLKKLKVSGDGYSSLRTFRRIDTKLIVTATPNLEQVDLDNLCVSWLDISTPTLEKRHLWPRLSKIILGRNLEACPTEGPDRSFSRIWRAFPPLTSGIRSIEILRRPRDTAYNLLFAADQEEGDDALSGRERIEYPSLPNLEVFRCMSEIELHYLQHVLEPAARSGSLKVLELTAALSWENPDFRLSKDLAFAHSDNLHTLGLREFNFYHDPNDRYGTSGEFDGQPFIDWLSCFPKLHTVAVRPAERRNVRLFVEKLILHPQVKVIHQNILAGVNRDHCMELAKQHGVTLHHTPNYMPVGWPLVED